MFKRMNRLSRIDLLLLVIGLSLLTLWVVIWIVDQALPPIPLLMFGFMALGKVGVRRERQVQPLDLRLLGLLGVLIMVVSYGIYAVGLHQNMMAVAMPCALGLSLVVGAVVGFLRGDY